jgi:hypothetical protein
MNNINTFLSTIFASISILILSCGSPSGENKNRYSGKSYTDVSTLEGSTKNYLEFNFIDDSVCYYFRNQYESESDKLYDYEGSKKKYFYHNSNSHLVLVKSEPSGNMHDTIRLEISGNDLIFHYGAASRGKDGSRQIRLHSN